MPKKLETVFMHLDNDYAKYISYVLLDPATTVISVSYSHYLNITGFQLSSQQLCW